MSKIIDSLALGATMYVPVIHPDVADIITGQRYRGLKSVVLCLEDALAVTDVDRGLKALSRLLEKRRGPQSVLTFVRPRNLAMAKIIATYTGIEQVQGFVVPKISSHNLGAWLDIAQSTHLSLMATLESQWVFDPDSVGQFIAELDSHNTERLMALRIGGNDLLSCLGLRCVRGRTVYEGPINWLMSQLMCRFGSRGYALTAPVFDVIDDMETLHRECLQDVDFGFVGKTAIHPSQVEVIHECFAVWASDVKSAQAILAQGASAVFKSDGAMAEPATHTEWAKRVLKRFDVYGYKQGSPATP